MPKRRKRLRHTPKAHRKPPTASTIRYPPSATVDAILATMMAERSADTAAPDADTIHFWGFACADHPTTQEAAHTAIVVDPDAERSPILDAAEWLIRRFPGRLWGFGLAYRTIGEMFTGPGGVPQDAIQAAMTGRLHERPAADEVCAATIFDARGFTYTSLTYAHLPELGPTPTWVGDTRTNTESWIELFDRRVVAAHAWAAAITLDPDANHAAIARLRMP
ncbi:hypothetical protein OHA40_22625 [Nocardia sp. NBC_00508]|uniref:hypothetical protein n=1 Tax=Nocardia sp. NBC_00508 TaxID=2975992 RepID=UPI002E803625|nr:hypothetical protein [Nocardia sp. NBC_00508]WUD64474.1 hypothetical protein OHA40_22625 [Nocardia sp. NBC_00508]